MGTAGEPNSQLGIEFAALLASDRPFYVYHFRLGIHCIEDHITITRRYARCSKRGSNRSFDRWNRSRRNKSRGIGRTIAMGLSGVRI